MKARHLLPLAALALPLLVQAKPAWPGLHKTVNPDGTTVEFRLHGDEHFSYITDAEGMLMKRDVRGALVYDLVDGVRIKATSEVVANMYQATLDMQANAPQKAPQRMAALDQDGRTTYPTIGSSRSLVVLVEFSDVKFQPNSAQEINDMLNKEGFDKYGSHGSARDFYKENSGGKYTPVFDVSRVVTLPNTSRYYTYNPSGTYPYNQGKYDRWREAIKYALDALSDEIDFSDYDCDGDGIIDTVYFFYAGYGQADTGDTNCIWPHQANLSYYGWKYDGVTMGPYACSNELNGQMHYYNKDMYLDGPGTFVHEFGHVLGMPDLYSPLYNGNETTPGDWDVMDGGSYNDDGYCPPALSAYEKWMYKWLEYTPATDNTSYSLKTTEKGGEAIRVPVIRKSGTALDSEYFILESRQKTNWDTFLPEEGMLIWHIQYDPAIWTQNRVNVTAGHPRVYILAADGSANPHNGGYGNPRRACWPGTGVNNTFITPETDITFQAYASNLKANPLDVYITSIAYDAEQGISTFDYNVVREAPQLTCNMRPVTRTTNSSGGITAGFVLEWDPAELVSPAENGMQRADFDADKVEYQVTVYRLNSSGSKVYEAGYNEKNVGSERMVQIKNLTSTKMGFEYHAYVRPVYGLPSATTSQEVVFTPKEVTDPYVSVGTIGADAENAPVYGVAGAVVAPQGAEIYNLSGVRVGAEGLAPGIYIVRVGSKVQKVTVR